VGSITRNPAALADGYEVAEYIPSKAVAHVRIVKKSK
jgi:hypothetical protein